MDKRRGRRISTQGVIDSYNFHAANKAVTIHAPLEISLRDLSLGGLGIKSSDPLDVDATLSMNIELDAHNFVVIGKIVWCKPSGSLFDCGVKLIYMPDELVSMLMDAGDVQSKYSN